MDQDIGSKSQHWFHVVSTRDISSDLDDTRSGELPVRQDTITEREELHGVLFHGVVLIVLIRGVDGLWNRLNHKLHIVKVSRGGVGRH